MLYLSPKLWKLCQELKFCTKLARSDKSERMNTEIAMREKSVVDRIKFVVRRESDAMKIDTEVPTASIISKTSTIDLTQLPLHGFGGDGGLAGWTTDVWHVLDMKTLLHPDSPKCSKKGYEEIHVLPTVQEGRIPIHH